MQLALPDSRFVVCFRVTATVARNDLQPFVFKPAACGFGLTAGRLCLMHLLRIHTVRVHLIRILQRKSRPSIHRLSHVWTVFAIYINFRIKELVPLQINGLAFMAFFSGKVHSCSAAKDSLL
jgi:hypothetical protein